MPRYLFSLVSKVLVLSALALSVMVDSSFAQVTTTAPTAGNSTRITRSYVVEGAVVVLLMGAACYAVCRSSRRV